MIYFPEKYQKDYSDLNKSLLAMGGEFSESEARISLAKFLRANIGFTTELTSGIALAPFQEIILKAWFNRNYCMNVIGRGGSKTFLAALYCVLKSIFEPNTKILIIGPTFRTARNLFAEMEKIIISKAGKLLLQCFTEKASKRTEVFEWNINGGSVKAIPLNGDKIRGFRANVLILDEFLLFGKDIVERVLMPFLVSPQNLGERIKIRELENEWIKQGKMREQDREVFENTAQMICLSSASFTFEYLYELYGNWVKKIYMSPEEEQLDDLRETRNEMRVANKIIRPTYFVAQMSYESLPEEFLDSNVINEAKSSGVEDPSFQREYMALFTDGSSGFYSAKKMQECTVPVGENPTLEIYGNKKDKYILSIDPNLSNSKTSDFFAMCVAKLNDETKTITIVHNYAGIGELKKHHAYFLYIMENFNIECIIIDNAGGEFISSSNESALFKEKKLFFDFFEFDSNKEGQEYIDECRKARLKYNKVNKVICFKQFFSSEFIRKSNEALKGNIDYHRIKFGSLITPNDEVYNCVTSLSDSGFLDITNTGFKEKGIADFISEQDILINNTKKQTCLIDVRSSPSGNLTFELPLHLRRGGVNRCRRDNYTCLLLINYLNKCYYDIINATKREDTTFIPFFVR